MFRHPDNDSLNRLPKGCTCAVPSEKWQSFLVTEQLDAVGATGRFIRTTISTVVRRPGTPGTISGWPCPEWLFSRPNTEFSGRETIFENI